MQWECTRRQHRSFGLTRNSIRFSSSIRSLIDMSPNRDTFCEPSGIIISTWSYWKCMEILNPSNRIVTASEWKWRKINCGFKKSISANHCNKSRFSFELQNSFVVVVVQAIKTATNEIQFRGLMSEFISALMDTFKLELLHGSMWSINKWIFTLSGAYAAIFRAVFSRKLKTKRFDTQSPSLSETWSARSHKTPGDLISVLLLVLASRRFT